jgi:hypothetical protein
MDRRAFMVPTEVREPFHREGWIQIRVDRSSDRLQVRAISAN